MRQAIHLLSASVVAAGMLAACAPKGEQAATAEAPAPAAPAAPAGWTLVPADSSLTFVSIKNNAVAEVHRFAEMTGSVDDKGHVQVQIPLAAVATGLDLRDQRLRDLLFEVARFPQASLTLDVDPAPVAALANGAHLKLQANATLDLHGVSAALPLDVRVTRTGDTQWLVTSERPAIVQAAGHELLEGIEALRKVAGLQAIGSAVPVSFTLAFSAGG